MDITFAQSSRPLKTFRSLIILNNVKVNKRARVSSFVVIGLPRALCIYTQVVRLSLKCGCGITIDKKLMSVCRLRDENKSNTLYEQISFKGY
jgi:hypothetical protein